MSPIAMTTVKLCECGCGQPAPLATKNDSSDGRVKGEPRRFIHGHMLKTGPRKAVTSTYRKVTHGGRMFVGIHRARAERALGKPLPPGAVVHHADGSMSDDAPLVICQDTAYHGLLHRRMRVRAAGGNPNTDAICGRCHQVKPLAAFGKSQRLGFPKGYCRECRRDYQREHR
jgi:hypothetical protein